jgi:hypothetical protein
MYNTAIPATLDDYQWPACAACQRDLWQAEYDRKACRPCEEKAVDRLAELGPLFKRLDTTAALMKGGRRVSSGPTGSRIPPLPLNVVVLNLAAAGGVATRLQAIEDSWRQALGWTIAPRTDGRTVFAPWRANPARDVPERIEFITNNLLWACSSYDSVGDDLEEIRRLHSETTAALSPDPQPGRVRVGHCPVRDDNGERCCQPLTATAANHRIHCGGCGARWDDMDAWRALRRDQDAMYAEMATVAA